MIRFKNGHELLFACGSGALAFDGRGWWWEHPLRWLGVLNPKAFTVVAKTVTMHPKKGNLSMWHPWTCVRPIKNKFGLRGATNAIGLTNPGLDAWIEQHYPVAQRKGYKIAASVKPDSVGEAKTMAAMLLWLDLAYVEVNVSCPNVTEVPVEIPEMLHELGRSGHPVVLKLSRTQACKEFIQKVDPFVDAYHAINTIPWDEFHQLHPYKIAFPQTSPIEKYEHGQKGGVSGQFIHREALRAVNRVRQCSTKPVIGGGGIFSFSEVMNFMVEGAEAFSIGTCFMLKPWRPNQIVRQYHKETRLR